MGLLDAWKSKEDLQKEKRERLGPQYQQLKDAYQRMVAADPSAKIPEAEGMFAEYDPMFKGESEIPVSYAGTWGKQGIKNVAQSLGSNLARFGGDILFTTSPAHMTGMVSEEKAQADIEQVASAIDQFAERMKVEAPTGKYARAPESFADYVDPTRIIKTVGEQGPLMASLMAATIANPTLGAALMVGVEGGETFANLKDANPNTRRFLSLAVGSVNAVFEKLGIDMILGRFPGLKSKIVSLALSPPSEGITEGLQEINQMLAEHFGEDAPLFTPENFDRLKEAVYGGVILGHAGVPIQGAQILAEERSQKGMKNKETPYQPGEAPQEDLRQEQGTAAAPEGEIPIDVKAGFAAPGSPRIDAQGETANVSPEAESARQAQENASDAPATAEPTEEQAMSEMDRKRDELRRRRQEQAERDKRRQQIIDQSGKQTEEDRIRQAQEEAQGKKPTDKQSSAPPKTVRAWVKGKGRINSAQLKEYGFGEGSRENQSLLLQIGAKDGLGVDELAEQAISEGVIPPPPADTNPGDWFMQQVKDDALTQEESIAEIERQAIERETDGQGVPPLPESQKPIRSAKDLQQRFISEMSLSEEEAAAAAAVYDAVAGAWAKVHGKKKSDWYKERIAGVEAKGNPDAEDVLFQFAGRESATADKHALTTAKQMIDKGAPAGQVRRETGWFKGLDGKWRYEISDKDSNLNDAVYQSLENHDVRKLGEILGHEKLFAAYPGFMDVVVKISDHKSGAVFHPHASGGGGWIEIRKEGFTPKEFKSVLLHEIQHAIQTQEGFASGGNVEIAPRIKQGLRELVEDKNLEVMKWEDENGQTIKDVQDAAKMLRRAYIYKDVQKLLDYSRHDRPSSLRRHILSMGQWLYDPLIKDASKEIQERAHELERRIYNMPKRHKMQERNQFLRDYTFDLAQLLRDLIPPQVYQQFKNDPRQTASFIKAFERKYSKARAKLAPRDQKVRELQAVKRTDRATELKTPFEIYEALYGEIEARNTQARADMTDEERRDTSPDRTQDVPNEEAIIFFNGKNVQAPNMANLRGPDLLRQSKKGAVQFLDDARAVIHAFNQADVSTALHELAHIFRRDLSPEDQQTVLDWAGADSFTVEVEEKFARAFERYLYEGKAPNTKLKAIFEKLKAWLREIYQQFKGSAIDVDISPEIQAIFDKVLTGEAIEAKEVQKPAAKADVKKGSSRSSSKGPAARPVAPDLPLSPREKTGAFEESDLADVKTLRQVAQQLANDLQFILGKNVRHGLIRRFRRRAKGLFFPDSGIIRVNNVNDLSTLAHEIGHYLDMSIFNLSDKAKYKQADAAVNMTLGFKDAGKRNRRLSALRRKYGNDVVNDIIARQELRKELYNLLEAVNYPKSARSVEEGIAEFVSNYIVNPKLARQHAPKFYDLFESILAQHEGLEHALKTARKNYQEFSQQDPRQLIESTIARDSAENRILAGLKKIKDNWYMSLVDGSKALQDIEAQLKKADPNLSSNRNPYLQFLSMLGAHGKLEQALNNHPFLRDPVQGVKILKDQKPLIGTKKNPGILQPILEAGKLHQFEGYLVALRNVEMFKRAAAAKAEIKRIMSGMNNNAAISKADLQKLSFLKTEAQLGNAATMGLEESQRAVELYDQQNPGWKQTREELQEYQDWALQYYRDSGKLSEEQYQKIKQLNKYYVPFKRYFAEWETNKRQPNLAGYIKDTSPSPVKRIKGSNREVLPPIGSIIRNTFDMIAAADQNYTLVSLIEAFNAIDKTLAQEIPPKVVKSVLVLPKDADGQAEVRYTVPQNEKPTEGHIVSVWNNGEVKYYDIPKDVYDAIFTAYEPLSRAIRMFSIPTNILRAGAVQYDPTFAVRNVPRDQTSAIFYSNYGYNPFHFFKGLSEAMGKTETYEKFLASGADQSFLTIVFEQLQSPGKALNFDESLESRFQRYRSKPHKILQDFNAASEIGTRVGAFQNALKKTGDVYKAMQEARNIGADYSIKGNAMRNIVPLLPFFNARIQHAKIFLKSAKNNPGKFIARGMGWITAPAMLIWFYNHEDDEVAKLYAELPNWRKVGTWNIHIPGTESFFYLPKGPAGIIFASTAEYFLDWLAGNDPDYLNQIGIELFKEMSPISDLKTGWVPQFGRPLIEQAFNRMGYLDRPIVPQYLEHVEPELQYDESTSELIKVMGQAAGLSPQRIQHFITAYTAGTGKGALYVADEILGAAGILETKPDDAFTRLGRIPLVRGFVAETPLGKRSKSVQDFYEALDRMDSYQRSVNRMATAGDDDRLADFFADEEKKRLYDYYQENKTSINVFRNILRVHRDFRQELNRERTPGRHERMREFDRQITQIAQRFHESYKKNEPFTTDELMKSLKALGKDIKKKKAERKESRLK